MKRVLNVAKYLLLDPLTKINEKKIFWENASKRISSSFLLMPMNDAMKDVRGFYVSK